MSKKIIISFVAVGVLAAIIVVAALNTAKTPEPAAENAIDLSGNAEPAKEISMDSFYEVADGKPNPQFSVKEIVVNKGDLVRINVTATKGAHNFVIDEYGVNQETPLDQTVTIEFRADKAGEFVYYCSKPGHRQNGHWGILKVLE